MPDARTVARSVGASRRSPIVLVADDEPSVCETTQTILRSLGVRALVAHDSGTTLTAARSQRIDLALIDWRLYRETGFDVVRTLQTNGFRIPWILVSGALDYELATEAGRRGALTSVPMPFDIENIVTTALAHLPRLPAWPSPPPLEAVPLIGSPVERCVNAIWRGYGAITDVTTTAVWARAAASGYSTLTAICRAVHVEAHDCRDFVRVLRGLRLTAGDVTELGSLLSADPRTLVLLFNRAGLRSERARTRISFHEFLATQRFIAPRHPVLGMLARSARS
jgi:DNA-binding response OmpR family regulator